MSIVVAVLGQRIVAVEKIMMNRTNKLRGERKYLSAIITLVRIVDAKWKKEGILTHII
jgi:hypothetical protein